VVEAKDRRDELWWRRKTAETNCGGGEIPQRRTAVEVKCHRGELRWRRKAMETGRV
jgi:hypothetical protein